MVAYSNKRNLPQTYFNACMKIASQYDKGRSDYTASQLSKPARQVVLEQENNDKIIIDVSELTWSVFGTVGHSIFENATTSGTTEQRIYSTYNGPYGGVVLGGQLDLIQPIDGDPYYVDVWDYKFVNTYAVIFDTKDKWTEQQNIYKNLLERNGYKVRRLNILAIFKNWSEREKHKKNYPPHDVMPYMLEEWDREKTEKLIYERLQKLEDAKTNLPLCTPEEQWRRGETWAVVSEQGGRALSGGVCSSREEAISVARSEYSNVKNVGVEHRRSIAKNCESYCKARDFCSQFKEEQKLGQSVFKPLTKKEKEK